jgi:hypothetical protein
LSRTLPGGGRGVARLARAPACQRSRHAAATDRARPLRVLSLVNVDFGPGTLLGMVLIGSGVALYQARPIGRAERMPARTPKA